MRVNHPVDRLNEVSKELCGRMKDAGVERMPTEISAALLDMSDGSHDVAVWNAWQYLSLARPLSELIHETSDLGRELRESTAVEIDDLPTWPMLTWASCVTFIAGAVIGWMLAS